MDLNQRIYNLVYRIPIGKVTTYGEIARKLNLKTPRIVGKALHNCNDTNCPCHRVVFSDGSLAKTFGIGGESEQRFKLIQEGVEFNINKVDIVKCLYKF